MLLFLSRYGRIRVRGTVRMLYKSKKERNAMFEQWNGFNTGVWQNEINVRDFIQQNYTPYEGGDSFLCGATDRTKALNAKLGI